MTKGLLLINLGTPEQADMRSVRRYLAEFLADKRVIDLPAPLRYLLLYGFILPFRLKASTLAYQSIWTTQGSPLLYHSRNLMKKVQQAAGKGYEVVLGMRYGQPSIDEALQALRHCQQITVLPLYPQYSSAASGSSLEHCLNLLQQQTVIPSLSLIRDFYQHPAFIQAQAELIAPFLGAGGHLLFSYHGLPERQLKKSGCLAVCREDCRPITDLVSNEVEEASGFVGALPESSGAGRPVSPLAPPQSCYRAQCYQTSRLLAERLQLDSSQYSTAFQSRLGRAAWIQPYTDDILPLLVKRGVKRVIVACPSFVADCLETLEEIGIRAREQWQRAGGAELVLVPCLNDSDNWVKAVLKIAGIAPNAI